MEVMDEYEKIRQIIKQPCNVAWNVPYSISSYKEVLEIWNSYKKTGKIINNIASKSHIERIFNFHLYSGDHIILYYSSHKHDCLWMCKVGGRYINIVVPMTPPNTSKSVIATYSCL